MFVLEIRYWLDYPRVDLIGPFKTRELAESYSKQARENWAERWRGSQIMELIKPRKLKGV